MTDEDNRKNKSHLIGYARVSTEDQNLEQQIEALTRFGVDPRDIYKEKVSGKSMNRPEWKALLKDARAGDTVVVWKIDRIGRRLIEVLQTAEQLKERGIRLRSLDGEVDMDTAAGYLFFSIMCAFAEMERRLTSERTKAGLAVARANGRFGGRPADLSDDEAREAFEAVEKGAVLAHIAKGRKPPLTSQAYINRWILLGLRPLRLRDEKKKAKKEKGNV